MRYLTRAAVLAAWGLFFVSASVHAQGTGSSAPTDSTKVALIHQLLRETKSVEQSIAVMDASVAAQRAANPRIPATFWDHFQAAVHARQGELEDLITGVYDRHFTTDDVKQLLAFYRTPVGQKVVAALPAITQESMVVGRDWGSRIGASVAAQLQSEGTLPNP